MRINFTPLYAMLLSLIDPIYGQQTTEPTPAVEAIPAAMTMEAAAKQGAEAGAAALANSQIAIATDDLRLYLADLCSDAFDGRCPGEPGEHMATAYFAKYLEQLGIEPAGEDGSFFDPFTFSAGMEFGDGENLLTVTESDDSTQLFKPGSEYHPLSISSSGDFSGELVFGGFGIKSDKYNSFEGLDVQGKWLLVLRGAPADRGDLASFRPLYRKAEIAKEQGAIGILYIKAANPKVAAELIPPTTSIGPGRDLLPALTITDVLAEQLLAASEGGEGLKLKEIFDSFNNEEETTGYPMPQSINCQVSLRGRQVAARNVLGRLVVGDAPSTETVIIGGHIDHLGRGNLGGSMARGDEAKQLHRGADDNASGIAVIMEIAQYLSEQKRKGEIADLKRDIIFAGWSAEETGIWGSRHYVKSLREQTDGEKKEIYPAIAAYVNLDMVGRASKERGLIVNGLDSSYHWRSLIADIPAIPDLTIKPGANHSPGDANPFYQAGVPVLGGFSGRHGDYHTPRDTIDQIDFPGLTRVTQYFHSMLVAISSKETTPSYTQIEKRDTGAQRSKVKLGVRVRPTDPDTGEGVLIAEVLEDTPAKKAGFLVGDIISSIDGKQINQVNSLLDTVSALKAGNNYPVTVLRGNLSENLDITLEPALIPFDSFHISVETNDWMRPRDKGESLNVSISVSRYPDDLDGSTEVDVDCNEFPAGMRMMPAPDRKAFLAACRAAAAEQAFDKPVDTKTIHGSIETRYRSEDLIPHGWMVRVSRADTDVLFAPEEGNNLSKAIEEAGTGQRWYRKLLANEEASPSENTRPPLSDGYNLIASVGKVTTADRKLSIEVHVNAIRSSNKPNPNYSLEFNEFSSSGGEWVIELLDEIQNSINAAKENQPYEKTIQNNDTEITVMNREGKSIIKVKPGSFFNNQDEIESSFSQTDLDRINALMKQTDAMANWFHENQELFYTKEE